MSKKINTILLVDDDIAINFFHKRLFTKLDIVKDVVSVYNGCEAVKNIELLNNSLTKDDIVLIFLDLNMPVMDGWEFLDNFKNISNHLCYSVEIFILSSSMNPDDIEKAKNNILVSNYFPKPLAINNVTVLLEHYF